MTWAELFERAAERNATVADVEAALADRRSGPSGGSDTADSAEAGDAGDDATEGDDR